MFCLTAPFQILNVTLQTMKIVMQIQETKKYKQIVMKRDKNNVFTNKQAGTSGFLVC